MGRPKKYHTVEEKKEAKKKWQKKYSNSLKGEETLKVYQKKEKYLVAKKKASQTDKAKLQRKNYRDSERGKEVMKSYKLSGLMAIWKKKYTQSEKGKLTSKIERVKKRGIYKKSTPKWNKNILTKKIYEYANYIQKKTGVLMDVDHIVPLRGICEGGKVCGLNVWYNLTIIPKKINLVKSNLSMGSEELKLLPIKEMWMDYIEFKRDYIIDEVKNPKHFENYLENWFKTIDNLKKLDDLQRKKKLMILMKDKLKVQKYLEFAETYNYDARKMLLLSPLAY